MRNVAKGRRCGPDLNVKSPFFLTQALAESLRNAASKEKPAKVINVASIDGIRPNPLETYSYQASKAALIHLTRARRRLRSGRHHNRGWGHCVCQHRYLK